MLNSKFLPHFTDEPTAPCKCLLIGLTFPAHSPFPRHPFPVTHPPREFERCVLGVHLAFCREQKPTICTQEERVTGQRGQKSPIRTRGSNDGGKNPQSASRSHSGKFQNYVSRQLIVLPFSNRSGFHSSRFVCGIPWRTCRSRKAATDFCDSGRQDSLSSNILNRKRSDISFIVQIIAIFAA